MFTAKLYFNEELQITVSLDSSDGSFSIVEESSGYHAEGTLEAPEAKKDEKNGKEED